MYKSATQISASSIARILATRVDISTLPGEPQIDIVEAVSIEIAKLFFFGDYLERMNSVEGFQSIILDEAYKQSLAEALGISYTSLTLGSILGVPSDLANDVEAVFYVDINALAADFGVTRKSAEYATGTVRFYVDSSSAFSLALGSKVSTSGSSPIMFSTTQSVSGVTPSVDLDENTFFVDVTVRADSSGEVGNVMANTIQVQSPATTRVLRVNNLVSTSGGKNRESNADLLARILQAPSSIAINTRQGYKAWTLAVNGIFDAVVVGAGDPMMTRATAGAVDIFVIGEDQATTTVKIKITVSGEEYILPFQPVLSVASVKDFPTQVPYTEGSGYIVVLDTAGGYAGSSMAVTKIVFDPSVGPAPGDYVEISFTYDAKILDLQTTLLNDAYEDVPGSFVLFKRGVRWLVVVEARIVPLPGYSMAVAQAAVSTAISDFLAEVALDKDIDYSDLLVVAAQATSGGSEVVDRIDLFQIARVASLSEIPVYSTANLVAESNEYYTFGVVNFT